MLANHVSTGGEDTYAGKRNSQAGLSSKRNKENKRGMDVKGYSYVNRISVHLSD